MKAHENEESIDIGRVLLGGDSKTLDVFYCFTSAHNSYCILCASALQGLYVARQKLELVKDRRTKINFNTLLKL